MKYPRCIRGWNSILSLALCLRNVIVQLVSRMEDQTVKLFSLRSYDKADCPRSPLLSCYEFFLLPFWTLVLCASRLIPYDVKILFHVAEFGKAASM